MSVPNLVTPEELAEALRCSVSTVYLKVRRGEWPANRISSRVVRFTDEQVEEIIAGVPAQTSPARNSRRLRAAMNQIVGKS